MKPYIKPQVTSYAIQLETVVLTASPLYGPEEGVQLAPGRPSHDYDEE